MKSLFLPYTKQNPHHGKLALSDWRSKKAITRSAEARKVTQKPKPRTLEKLNGQT